MGLIAVLFFIAMLVSLGVALRALLRRDIGESRSKMLVNALTVRVTLAVLFFALLMAAWYAGWIEPHGLGG
jgi:hypothetical protein